MEDILTMESLTQDVLSLAWNIWYRCGYPDRPDVYRYPTPTPGQVSAHFLAAGRATDHRLGISGHIHAKLWIKRRNTGRRDDGVTPIYFWADPQDYGYGKPPEEQQRLRELCQSIIDAWREAGLPVDP